MGLSLLAVVAVAVVVNARVVGSLSVHYCLFFPFFMLVFRTVDFGRCLVAFIVLFAQVGDCSLYSIAICCARLYIVALLVLDACTGPYVLFLLGLVLHMISRAPRRGFSSLTVGLFKVVLCLPRCLSLPSIPRCVRWKR